MAKKDLLLHDGQAGPVPASGPGLRVINLSEGVPWGLDRSWSRIRIFVNDTYRLQGLRALLEPCGTARILSITVKTAVPNTLLHGPIGLIDGHAVIEVSRRESADKTELSVKLQREAPAWKILAACTGARGLPGAPLEDLRVGVSPDLDPAWFGLRHNSQLTRRDGSEFDPDNQGPTPFCDIHVTSEAPDVEPAGQADLVTHGTIHIDDVAWQDEPRARGLVPPFDPRIFNPIGAVREPQRGFACVHAKGASGLAIADERGRALASSAGSLNSRMIGALRDFDGLIDLGSAHRGPTSRALFVSQALAAGIPVVSADAEQTLDGHLPTRMLRTICSDTDVLRDHSRRECHIVDQVRESHRALPELASRISSAAIPGDRSVSVVLSTKRPDNVRHALRSFVGQSWHDKELLLGFHGFTIDDLDMQTRELVGAHARVIEFPRATIFGDVLRGLTLAADGVIVAKMDDDDWYGPHHLEDLVYALGFSGAELVGSGVQFIYMHKADITIRRGSSLGYRYGGHPGGPTITALKSVILEAGNWPRVRRAVDTSLAAATSRMGGSIFVSHPLNFMLNRRESGHTWKATTEYFIVSARETWPGLRKPDGFGQAEMASTHWRSHAPYLGASLPAVRYDQVGHSSI